MSAKGDENLWHRNKFNAIFFKKLLLAFHCHISKKERKKSCTKKIVALKWMICNFLHNLLQQIDAKFPVLYIQFLKSHKNREFFFHVSCNMFYAYKLQKYSYFWHMNSIKYNTWTVCTYMLMESATCTKEQKKVKLKCHKVKWSVTKRTK